MEKNLARARRDLALVVRELARQDDVRHKLAELKRRSGDLDRADFVWYKLLTSFETMGSSRGARALNRNPRVTFDAMKRKSAKDRIKELRTALHAAKAVRWPEKKARWLADNYDRIVGLGFIWRLRARQD